MSQSYMAPGLGDLGTIVLGKSTPTTVDGNGAIGTFATITVPSAGVWLVYASGWNPGEIDKGMVSIGSPTGYTIATTGIHDYTFNIVGVHSTEAQETWKLQVTNWTSSQKQNVASSGLVFKAVKVGLL